MLRYLTRSTSGAAERFLKWGRLGGGGGGGGEREDAELERVSSRKQ